MTLTFDLINNINNNNNTSICKAHIVSIRTESEVIKLFILLRLELSDGDIHRGTASNAISASIPCAWLTTKTVY